VNLLKKMYSAFAPKVSVGKIVLPLHGGANATQKMLHHMAMQEAAGTNHLGHPRGFRQAPTSHKNPKTHKKAPQTRLESLAKLARAEGLA